MDLISVIVPVYNVKNFLNRCVDSILKQTYSNIEIVLVDDGSNDGSEVICDQLAHNYDNVRVIHKPNGGLSSARNAGIAVAKGKYIGFVDSDDFIDLDMYKCLYDNIIKTKSDISICKPYKFSKEDEIVESKEVERIKTYENIEILRHMYDDYFTMVVAWNKLYKKELFDEIRYPEGKIIEDSAIIHYLLYNSSKIVISNKEMYFYYQRDESIMHKSNLKLLDELDALYDRIKFFESKSYEDEYFYIETLKMYVTQFWYLFKMLNKSNFYKRKYYKKYFKNLKEILKKNINLENKEKIKYSLFCKFKYFFLLLIFGCKIIRKIGRKMTKIYDLLMFKLKYNRYIAQVKRKRQNRYLIFNGPNHGNLGDHAILYAEKKFLEDKGIKSFEILSHQIDYFIERYGNNINLDDVIMITGGGNLGTLWEHEQIGVNKVISRFKDYKILIFPQTIFYSKDRHAQYRLKVDKLLYEKCKKLLVCCRDKKTYDFCLSELKVNAKYTSDIVTYLNYSNENYKRDGVMICFRLDKEKVLSKEDEMKIKNILMDNYEIKNIRYIDTVLPGRFSFSKGKRKLLKLLKEIAHTKIFITDRLHGMIFAAITGTPCIALANSSGKVKGVFDWISKENDYVKFANNIGEIENLINEINLDKKYYYKNENIKKSLEDLKI